MPQSIAIIGASANRGKFGNRAVRAYQQAGWTVYPVNLRELGIEGLTAFRSVLDIPGPVDLAALYLPPEAGIGVLPEIARKGIPRLFLNPGTESAELVNLAQELGLNVTQG